nr:heterogeneous nuclear ribonucleoprotein [Hymenolepis microstoma]
MAQSQSGNEENNGEQIINEDTSVIENGCSLSHENHEDQRTENNFSGSPRPNKKIFVGALTPETTEQNLTDYFSKFGELVSCAIKVFRETGHSRGFGFVIFKNEESVKKVLSIPEHFINGKKIDPKPAKCPKDTQRKVFVGGLDPGVTPKEIEEHFSKFGKVEAVETPYDSTRMRRRSYVFVIFSSEYEAKRAASVERQEINGRTCDVRVAVPREVSMRQRGLAQGPVQFTFADLHNAMLNLFLYNSLNQQPALQSHFAWPQAAAPANVAQASNRSPFRAGYDHQQQQASADKLFSQAPAALSRNDAPWYDSSSVVRQPAPAQSASVGSSVMPRNQPVTASTHPYLTFPIPYHSAATLAPAPPQHFYYQTTPGYYYQPAPTAPITPPDQAQSSNGAPTNGAPQPTNAMNDFMATLVTANQMGAPFIASQAAYPAVSNGVTDMSYLYRQQSHNQHQQHALNPGAYYQPAEGIFSDRSSHFYNMPQAPSNNNTGCSPSPLKPRGPKSHLNGMRGSSQNGHSASTLREAENGVDSTTTTNGVNSTPPQSLEAQMATLTVSEI